MARAAAPRAVVERVGGTRGGPPAKIRYTEALTRAADTDRDAAFQRFHDALAENFSPEEILEDRRRRRQHERLDADQACRGRDASPA